MFKQVDSSAAAGSDNVFDSESLFALVPKESFSGGESILPNTTYCLKHVASGLFFSNEIVGDEEAPQVALIKEYTAKTASWILESPNGDAVFYLGKNAVLKTQAAAYIHFNPHTNHKSQS